MKRIDISFNTNPEGWERYEIEMLAWKAFVFENKINEEEYRLYEKWFWELA